MDSTSEQVLIVAKKPKRKPRGKPFGPDHPPCKDTQYQQGESGNPGGIPSFKWFRDFMSRPLNTNNLESISMREAVAQAAVVKACNLAQAQGLNPKHAVKQVD